MFVARSSLASLESVNNDAVSPYWFISVSFKIRIIAKSDAEVTKGCVIV